MRCWCEIAHCLRSRVRKADVLARLGGDEFMVILDGLHAREEAARVAENFLEAVSSPMQIQGHDLTIGASIGISIFPEDATGAEDADACKPTAPCTPPSAKARTA